MSKAPLVFTYYIAAPVEKVWDGFVSKASNQTIFMGANFEVDLKPGGAMTWSGPGKDPQNADGWLDLPAALGGRLGALAPFLGYSARDASP